MSWLTRVRRYLRDAARGRQMAREIDDELQFHVDALIEELTGRGASPEEARRIAARRFGRLDLMKDEARYAKGVGLIDDLRQDVRFGLRTLRQQPAFAAVAVLTLALGIGANSALFSLANALLLRPLPVRDPGSLVLLYQVAPRLNPHTYFSYPNYAALRDGNDVFAGVAAFAYNPVALSGGPASASQPERVLAAVVTANYFDLLGIRPAAGRLFLPHEERGIGAHPVVVLSHDLWTRRFDRDRGVIDRRILINNYPFTIVGIAPPDFTSATVGVAPALWVPAMMQPRIILPAEPVRRMTKTNQLITVGGESWLTVIGRLKPGVTLQQAEDRVRALLDKPRPGARARGPADWGTRLRRLDATRLPVQFEGFVGDFVNLLAAVTGLVLLIACANVAGLLLQRASGRHAEIGMRLALGAGRLRIIRQVLTEGLLLAALGGLAGLVVARAFLYLLNAFRPPVPIPVAVDLSLDWRALLFTMSISALTAILFGVAPAIRHSGVDLVSVLKGEHAPRRRRRAGTRARFQRLLVSAQIALAMVLLAWAALLLGSLRDLQATDVGFNRNLMLASMNVEFHRPDEAEGQAFYTQLLDRVRRLPGVVSASLADHIPLTPAGSGTIINYDPRRDTYHIVLWYTIVTPDYFRTMGIRFVSGRDFTDQDRHGQAVILNENLVRHAREDIRDGRFEGEQIVGVVRQAKYYELTETPQLMQYLPFTGRYTPRMTLIVRYTGDAGALAAAIRREVSKLEPTLPLYNVGTMEEHLKLAFWPSQILAGIVTVFGILAFVLAGVGTYGVAAYSVSQRTHEMGVRIALGATPGHIYRLVARHAAWSVLFGVALGTGAAAALAGVVGSFVFGVRPNDPATLAGVCVFLIVAAVVAVTGPAHRAASVDPAETLRCE